MFQQPSKRRQVIRRAVTYTFMVSVVLLLSAALVLLLLGYRFNSQSGTLVQGGLVQFISQPSGARVTVGAAQLANTTRSKITLNPGSYDVTMTLDGYRTWKKRVTVKAGTVLWLNSAQFVPSNPQTKSVKAYASLSSMSVRPGGQYAALLTNSATPEIDVAKITGDTPEITTLTLPSSLYTAATSSHVFSLGEWSSDDQYVLMKHTYDDHIEWIAVDRTDVTKSRLIPTGKDSYPADVIYNPRSSDHVLVRSSSGIVSDVNLSDGSSTTLPLSGVQTMDAWGSNLFYTSVDSDGKTVSTGYLTLGSSAPRVVQSYDVSQSVHFSGGQYFGSYYFATSVGKQTTVTSLTSLPDSASTDPLQSEVLHVIASPHEVSDVDFKSGGRFVTVTTGVSQAVYDIELDTESIVPIVGLTQPLTSPLEWLDEYHFWSDSNGSMRQYEFDGSNQTDIVKVAPGFKAVYSQDDKYLYTIGKTSDGYQLQQTKMIIK